MNRRAFLRTSGAVAGSAAAPLMAATPAARLTGGDVVRVAVIGVKGRGRTHVRGFAKKEGSVVATICDVDPNIIGEAMKSAEEGQGFRPKYEKDLRRVLDDKEIDAVSIATPDHWHALAAIWACQAGKDVYVEKPVSHNVSEGRRIVEAARYYNRIVQTGTQSRSSEPIREAIEFLRQGGIGKIYMAKGLCYKRRKSIGRTPVSEPPAGVDYDLWLGPAPRRPFTQNRFHYKWHWFWDYGTTDMGNQGIHQMDIARWGLGRDEYPLKIHGAGGKFVYDDDQETPNTQQTVFEYSDGAMLQFEVRGLLTHDELGVKVGNIFYGENGYLTIAGGKWQSYLGEDGERGPGNDGKAYRERNDAHFQNFLAAVRDGDAEKLSAPILEGHLSSALCHLGNVSYRTGRKLIFDGASERFPNDAEANSYLTRNYRKPFTVPARIGA